jgi:hypothetical protein
VDNFSDPSDLGPRLIRRFTEGTLVFGDRAAPAKFVVDGACGRVVLPVEPPAADFAEFTLHVPDEQGEVVHLQLHPAPIARPEAEEAVDRWAAYHGRSARTTWVRCGIEAGKGDGRVFDGSELTRPNTLRGSAEAKIVRSLNADLERVAGACERVCRVKVADPRVVGVDPLGFDVRARFGVVRMEFEVAAADAEGAMLAAQRLLGGPARA